MKNSFFIVVSIALLLFSCGSSKNVSHTKYSSKEKLDSISYVERVIVDTFTVPAETLEVKVPFEVLKVDTIMVFKNGRVKTEIKYLNGNLELLSTVDSLNQLVLSKETLLQSFKDTKIDEKESFVSKKVKGVGWFYKMSAWVSGILILALLIWIAIKLVKKYYKPI